jgi:putative ABC transport system permease protein
MREILRDVRFGVRKIVKARFISALIVVTLALAIGVTSTIVSLMGAVLTKPFPDVKDPARVVWFFERKGDVAQSSTSNLGEAVPFANYFKWKTDTTQFEELAAISPAPLTVQGAGEPVRAKGFAASPNYFRLLGATIAFGRDFAADEDMPGRDEVAILGHAFAERRFGSASAAVGNTIATQGRTRTIIGVLSRSFAFPGVTDLWVPLVIDPEMRANGGERELIVFARLKAGATLESANQDVAAIAPRLAAEFPDTNRGRSAQVLNLHEVFISKGRYLALASVVAALLALVVAAINVGNILFAQGTARQSEFALRAALGAPRTRLIRQLVTECFILCAAGGALGILLSMWGLDLFVASMPERIANRMRIYWELRFDETWTVVAIGVTFVATIVAGLWPAWRISEVAPNQALKEHGPHATTSRSHRRILRSLVTAQIAIALVLFTGAACGIAELLRTERQDLGFDPRGALSALVRREEKDEAKNRLFFGELETLLRAIPGAGPVGLTSVPPLERGSERMLLAIPGRPPPPPGEELEGKLTVADGDYFKAAGIEVISGNVFTAKDDAKAPAVAVLSRNAANMYFPGQEAIGKTIVLIDRKIETPCVVIGIVDDVAAYWHAELGMVYRSFAQVLRGEMAAIVRGNPALLDRAVRDAVYALDRAQPVETISLQAHVDEFRWDKRTVIRLIAIPAGLAILLSILGVYGLAAYSLTQRRSELGIRAALGAPPRALVATVMREAVWVAAIGGGIGLVLSVGVVVGLGRVADLRAFPAAATPSLACALVIVVLLASFAPARRAATTPPSLALRS